MQILVMGHSDRREELALKISAGHIVEYTGEQVASIPDLSIFDLVFDLNFDDHPEDIIHYEGHSFLMLVVGAAKYNLQAIIAGRNKDVLPSLIGMNTWPTCINRGILEWTVTSNQDQIKAQKLADNLGWEVSFVADKIGMVTPRVLAMIINEAFFTIEDRTATVEDIDNAMKLGTNYPFGPFEWANKIGISEIYQTLDAIFNNTGDPRYRICPTLKTYYLKNTSQHH